MSRIKTAALVVCSVVGLPLLAVVLGGVWLTGEHRADAEAWKRTRRTRTPRRPMLVRDAAPYDTAEGSVRRGGLAA
jgi:hypothetical protein